ncbi:MAG TPA: YjbQ family protein [Geothrix sp.]|nr:YjbQ family protein [Geothrix sp.]
MKSHRQVLTLHVPERTGMVNITRQVEAAVTESGVREGLCLVNSMHITSSVFINDEEAGLKQDYLRWLERLAPFNAGADPATGGYLHNRSGEDNGDAHHRGSISGRREASRSRLWRRACDRWRADHGFRIPPSVYRTVPRTVLPIASLSETEPREQIFYGELDGRRDKRVLIKIIGE